MRVCEACGTPVSDSWEHCLRCGEELPPVEPQPSVLRERIVARFRRRGEGRSVPKGQRQSTFAALNSRVPAWTFAPLLLAIVALLWILAVSQDDGALVAVRDAAATEAMVLAQSLEQVEAERDRLAAAVVAAEEQVAALETSVESGSSDLDDLRADLASAQAAAAAAQAEADSLRQELQDRVALIAAMDECLNGTVVALAFARDGRDGAADVALASVAAACEVAGG